jgi:hypothetical protein
MNMSLTQQSAFRKDLNTARHGVELQHRHFSFIAAVIKDMRLPEPARGVVALEFAAACAGSNPRFDRQRFLSACNVK